MTVMMMLAAAALAQDAPQVVTRSQLISGSISNADYPSEARNSWEEGVVAMRYTVTTSGEVIGCTVTTSSGSAPLDSASCALVTERFRFAPAKDGEGRAIAEERTQSIRWQLPPQSTSDSAPLLEVVVDRVASPPTCLVMAAQGRTALPEAVRARIAGASPPPDSDAPAIFIKASDLPTLLSLGTPAGAAPRVVGGEPSSDGPPVRAMLTDGYISDADYPDVARRLRQEGEVAVHFRIDTNGRVRDCTVQESSGSALLDRTTCTLVEQRFRFRPARDANGAPTEDERSQRITWALP